MNIRGLHFILCGVVAVLTLLSSVAVGYDARGDAIVAINVSDGVQWNTWAIFYQ